MGQTLKTGLPGTHNHKYTPPREVVFESLIETRLYDPLDFAEWLPEDAGAISSNGHATSSQVSIPEGTRIPEGIGKDTLYRLKLGVGTADFFNILWGRETRDAAITVTTSCSVAP